MPFQVFFFVTILIFLSLKKAFLVFFCLRIGTIKTFEICFLILSTSSIKNFFYTYEKFALFIINLLLLPAAGITAVQFFLIIFK